MFEALVVDKELSVEIVFVDTRIDVETVAVEFSKDERLKSMFTSIFENLRHRQWQ